MSRATKSIEYAPSGEMYLGSKVRWLRQRISLTLEQFADSLGYHVASISRVETNTANPSDHLLAAIAGRLGVPLEELRAAPIHPRLLESHNREAPRPRTSELASIVDRLRESVERLERVPSFDPAGFARVDESGDPAPLLRYLEYTGGLETIRAYKQRTYELLGVEEGHRLLDAGCGTGGDAVELARLVGKTGRVVGIDLSAAMITQAREKAKGLELSLEFRTGDVRALREFPDNSFDGCRIDRVLQHLETPRTALAEMIRVARPGARVVAFEVDWETLVVSPGEPAITRKILHFSCDSSFSNGWMGRQLLGLLKELGLEDLTVIPETGVFTRYGIADEVFRLGEIATRAGETGAVTAGQAANWLELLERASRAGRFFSSVTGFIVGGRKPQR